MLWNRKTELCFSGNSCDRLKGNCFLLSVLSEATKKAKLKAVTDIPLRDQLAI